MSLFTVPAVAALALLLVPLLVRILDRQAGWPLAVVYLGLAGYVGSHARGILDGTPVTASVTWVDGLVPGLDGGLSLALRLDALSLFFTLLALVIGAVVFVYSTQYLHVGRKILSFYLFMATFMTSILLLVLADDVTVLFFAWETVSLCSFFLIARSGSSGEAGSVRTLILTFAGGLLLLAAVGVMVAATGTTSLTGIIHSDVWAREPGTTTLVAVLVALAGFSKAAQFPFHAWLPEAMAADTPVSAFLHAAAVVKAGVYVLIRFSGMFHGTAVWHVMLVGVGMTTAVAAAVFALQKTDLKKLTAYSTVSQLGWIVATIGIGTPFAITAAILHTAAHAMFKSSLFMLIGVVDHATGTRDIRRLGPLWNRMPFTFAAAVLSAASMAGIPPLLGFVSKEGMLDAFLDAPFTDPWVVVLLVAATGGAVATFLYSARYVFGTFIDGRRDMSHVHEASPLFWVPAALPGVLSLPAVFWLSRYDAPLDAVAAVVTGEDAHSHLGLWHGVTVPVLVTAVVVVLGVVGVTQRHRISRWSEGRKLFPVSGAQLIALVVTLAARWGRLVSRPAASMAPSQHVVWILGSVIALGMFSLLGPGRLQGLADLPPRMSGIDDPTDLIALVIVALSVGAVVSTRSRLASIVLSGIAGVGVSWLMLTLGAPDVALTQLLVEFLVVVVMMLVVRHQPRLYLREGENRAKFATVLATIVGLVTFVGVWLLTGRHGKPPLADWYLDNAPEISSGNNVVNTILVEFRAFDTLGELTVLGMTGIVIAAVVASVPRSPLPGYGPGSTAELFRAEGSTRFPDVHKVPELAPFYSKYLRSTHLNSIPTRALMPYLLPVLGLVSFTVFMRGHNAPGGGFIAALVASGALFTWYLGAPRNRTIGGRDLGYRLIGGGVVLAMVTGLAGYAGGGFLTPLHGHIGSMHVTTSMVFDLGVYLSVIGMVIVVVNQLGGRERPGRGGGPAARTGGADDRAAQAVPAPTTAGRGATPRRHSPIPALAGATAVSAGGGGASRPDAGGAADGDAGEASVVTSDRDHDRDRDRGTDGDAAAASGTGTGSDDDSGTPDPDDEDLGVTSDLPPAERSILSRPLDDDVDDSDSDSDGEDDGDGDRDGGTADTTDAVDGTATDDTDKDTAAATDTATGTATGTATDTATDTAEETDE
ncbi:DUF4040 family protein [Corynebacterium bovis]|uniref:DUF4040 family protein n=1 Tax=Corynebacterium bovis TaxID=36808 RepID=UPI003139BC28